MITSESIKSITEALLNCDFPVMPKHTQGYGYKYVNLDDILDKVKPILKNNKLIIVQSVGSNDIGVSITTRIQHISGEFFQDTMILPLAQMKNANNVQAMGASITYGKRYGITAMLGLSADEDIDANISPKSEGLKVEAPYTGKKRAVTVMDKEFERLSSAYEIPKQCTNWATFDDETKKKAISFFKGEIEHGICKKKGE